MLIAPSFPTGRMEAIDVCEYNGAQALTISSKQKYSDVVFKVREWMKSKNFPVYVKVFFWTGMKYDGTNQSVVSRYNKEEDVYVKWYSGTSLDTDEIGVGLIVSGGPTHLADQSTGMSLYGDKSWAYPICEIRKDDYIRLGLCLNLHDSCLDCDGGHGHYVKDDTVVSFYALHVCFIVCVLSNLIWDENSTQFNQDLRTNLN